jgi:uncharacterized protein YwqG
MAELDTLKSKISEAGLGGVAERILELVRPCYRIGRVLTPDEGIPIGSSRFGGSPDVSAGFTWPHVSGSGKAEPMEFVGQIRLSDLPEPVPESLPRDGLLSFFTRWSEASVFYCPAGTPLQRATGPNPLVAPAPSGFVKRFLAELKRNPDPRQTYRSCALAFAHGLSLPDGSSSIIEQMKLSRVDSESYSELVLDPPSGGTAGEKTQHRMFGYASPVQNEMELECDFVRRNEEVQWNSSPERFISATRDWVLLLQVDTDDYPDGPGWMWGDAGMVYFWIHREDLAARAFDKVICIEQCH